jgi:hypothetical protein
VASVTLAESAKLTQDMLIAGVIESVITVNRFYELLPFSDIAGNSLAYNRENVLGDVQMATVGTTITAKNPATFTQVTSALTTIIGDAEVNGLVQATRSNINDQTGVQVASKAKSAGRKYQNLLVNGTGTSDEFTGLLGLVDSSKIVTTATNGSPISFALLDELIDAVTDKDGTVDYIMMPRRTIRAYNQILRDLGGATIGDVVTLPSGTEVPAYRNVPIFANDWIPVNQVKGTSSAATTILAGTIDDGSMTHGISGLTAVDNAGLGVEYVGVHQSKDEKIYRVKWYCGLALFSLNGLAAITGITS